MAATMLVGSLLCTSAFAAEAYNGEAYGKVGEFNYSVGNWNNNNIVNGDGVIVDARAHNFYAVGNVGLFNGYAQDNKVTGIGAEIGNVNRATAIGTVGTFQCSHYNIIEFAKGAVVYGNGGTANGQVGIFDKSFHNQILSTWGDGGEQISIGAYIGGGASNIANGTVGIFNHAGGEEGLSHGNIIYASIGAGVEAGKGNIATGVVGRFNGKFTERTDYDGTGNYVEGVTEYYHTNIEGNIIKPSMGAYIVSGNDNIVYGEVGRFDATAIGAGMMTGNVVQGTGAYVVGGNSNNAYGYVGIFNGAGSHTGAYFGQLNNTVEGMGVYVTGGMNNLAIGTVGNFAGDVSNNIVKGNGVIITKPNVNKPK